MQELPSSSQQDSGQQVQLDIQVSSTNTHPTLRQTQRRNSTGRHRRNSATAIRARLRNSVEVKDADAEAVAGILTFLYTGRVDDDIKDYEALGPRAPTYKIVKECQSILRSHNVLVCFQIAPWVGAFRAKSPHM